MPEPAAEHESAPSHRGTFGLAVGVGILAAGTAVLAGARTWATVGDGGTQIGGDVAVAAVARDWPMAPLVSALGVVLVVVWGIVLVTRGRFRLLTAWLGLIVATGLLVTAVAYFWGAPGALNDRLAEYGSGQVDVERTWWSWLGGVAGALSVLAAGLAVRDVGAWPEMGRRYDAPGSDPDDDTERTNIDIWKSIDEGRDPSV